MERKALDAFQPVTHAGSRGDPSDPDDDISVIETMPWTVVTEAVKAIRDFIQT